MKATAAALLLLIWAWLYWPVRTASWVFEDVVTQHYTRRSFTTFTWNLFSTPQAAHLVNLGLALLVCLALLAVAWRLELRGLGLWAVAVGCLLHPIMVESVAYAASRGELLAAVCVLVACLAAAGERWSPVSIGIVIVASGLAMLSKESGVVAIALVPLTIWQSGKSPVVAIILGLLMGDAVVAHFGGLRVVVNIGTTDFVNASAITWVDWIGLQAASAHHWLGSFIWLRGFTPDWDVDAVPVFARWISLGVLSLLPLGAWLARRSLPMVSFGLIWCVLALAPRFVVQTPQSMLNAHQMLIPCLGLFLSVGAAFHYADERMAACPR